MDNQTLRERLKDKKRIVVKVGSSSLTHAETGSIDLIKMEKLVRELTDLHNRGKEVILVSSGAIAVGRKTIGMKDRPSQLSVKQACASIGQARLMMMYQKFFMEYNQIASQVLMTKNTLVNGENRINARNTFDTLLHMGAIPIVNENDTISTYEIQFGDNDTLSAVVAALVQADLLILLSDIDGLFTDDPNKNPDAKFIDYVDHEWCWRAESKGFVNGITLKIKLAHFVGQQEYRIFNQLVIISAPIRYYYQTRNYLWLLRRSYVPRQWKINHGIKLMIYPISFPFKVRCWRAIYVQMFRGLKDGLLNKRYGKSRSGSGIV